MRHLRTKSVLRLGRSGVGVALWLCIVSASSAYAQPAAFHAGRITPDTTEPLRIRGSDAIAGLGDWHISNGTLCAAIQGTEHHGQLVPGGGYLVDLGHCGRDDDQWIALEPLYNLSRDEMFRVVDIEAQVHPRGAQIITRASDAGLELTTRYVVDNEQPTRLEVRTTVTRKQTGARFFSITDILVHAVSSLRNFMVNDGGAYSGFRHTSRTKSGYLEIAGAIRTAQGIVLVGSDDQGPPISYLYRVRESMATNENGAEPLNAHSIGFSSMSAVHFGTQPAWFPGNEPGFLNVLALLVNDVPLGESIELRREIWISTRADVASLTDRLYRDVGSEGGSVHVTGTTADIDSRVHVFRAGDQDGSHITMARPDASGKLSFYVPRGNYRFEFIASAGRRLVREIDLSSEGQSVELGAVVFSKSGRVQLPSGHPMRLVFRGQGDTPDPNFGDDLTGLTLGGDPKLNSHATSDVHLSGEGVDPAFVDIAPGQYQVYATRGPEFSLTKTKIEIAAGQTLSLDIDQPTRLFETTGWISADFHVHTAVSFDSTLAPAARLRSFIAEGAEVLVATEHDAVGDVAGMIDDAAFGDRITVLGGLEVTTISPTPRNPYTTGHLNVYPYPYRPDLNRGGAIQDEGLRLREIIARTRALPDAPIVQINHPRDVSDPPDVDAFFGHLSVMGTPFDPDQPLDSDANKSLIEADPISGIRDIDFDAMELLNSNSTENYRAVLRDWFSLLAQGRRISGMANSDSHQLSSVVAVPRTYVRFEDRGIEQFDQNGFYDAVRRGHLYGTTGPLLDVNFEGAGPGDQFSGSRGKLSINIRSAPWVPVSILRIYVNGRLEIERAIDEPSMRAELVALEFTADAFIVVEVEGVAGGDYAEVLPEFTPLAFTNPIFVDADEDGSWTPPGLP